MELPQWVSQTPEFARWNHAERIKAFAWYLHVHKNQPRFSPADIRRCFADLSVAGPANVNSFLTDLKERKPPHLLYDKDGYFLERTVRDQFDAKYGQRAVTVEVVDALRALPQKLPNLAEQAYLEEALICFRHSAFRASAVMCWNLAYDHLCTHILATRLSDFNTELAKRYPREGIVVATREDFHELQESKVLEVCRIAGITTKTVHGVLVEKLNTRNRVAHASGTSFLQPQAEAYILDLLNNAVLKF